MLKTAINGANPKLNRAERRRREREARKAASTSTTNDLGLTLQAVEALRQQGRLEDAEAACRKIVADYPAQVEGLVALGTVLQQRHLEREAYKVFTQAVELHPQFGLAWHRLGKCLLLLKQYDAALIAFGKASALSPPNAEIMLFLGRTLQQLDRSEDALAVFTEAVERFPGNSDLLLEKGLIEQTMGQFEVARATLQRTIEIDPSMMEAHFRLAAMGNTAEDEEISLTRLNTMAENASSGVPRRAAAHFAVARIHNKAKRYDDAFEAYRTANDLLHETVSFNPDEIKNYVTLCEQSFTPEVFEATTDTRSATRQPIFIVGMPRSGTTLTEQVISSHPAVAGGGEELKFTQLAEALLLERSGSLSYPRDIAKIDPKLLAPIGDQYLAHMRRRFPDAERITDKNAFNFHNIGLIGILYPNADIIHCRRDPMDTCLSCYFQYFGDGTALSFTTDLGDLAFFYKQYERIMAHWHSVLPGRILDVSYEDMVADQEGMSRRIIDHLGLPWDDACLRFDKNERSVRTASQWQVRQPIYKTSVERWRAFEQHLGPLKEGLGVC